MKTKLTLALIAIIFNVLPSLAITRYVTANLNMRCEPTTGSQVITVIPKGTPVEIGEDCECDWIPIRYGYNIGYVSTKYLSTYKVTSSSYGSQSYSNSSTKSRSTYRSSYSGRGRYYTNVDGIRVQSPTHYSSAPSGATALCNDGTYSFSRHRRGTCSRHGGVARWF